MTISHGASVLYKPDGVVLSKCPVEPDGVVHLSKHVPCHQDMQVEQVVVDLPHDLIDCDPTLVDLKRVCLKVLLYGPVDNFVCQPLVIDDLCHCFETPSDEIRQDERRMSTNVMT